MREVDYQVIGERIRRSRKKAGLTQEKLAELVGISLPFLGHIERGTRKPSLETIVRLSDVLSGNIHFWLTGEIIAEGKEEIIDQFLLENMIQRDQSRLQRHT